MKIPVNDRFLSLVRQGQKPGCELLARDARNFAEAVVRYAVTFGDEEARGLMEWINWTRQNPNDARHFLED